MVAPAAALFCLAACTMDQGFHAEKGDADSGGGGGRGGGDDTTPPECERLTCVQAQGPYLQDGYCTYDLYAGYSLVSGPHHINKVMIFGLDSAPDGRPPDDKLWFIREDDDGNVLSSVSLEPEDLAEPALAAADWYVEVAGTLALGTLNDWYDAWKNDPSDPTVPAFGLDFLRIEVDDLADVSQCEYLPMEVCLDPDVGEWWVSEFADEDDWVLAEAWSYDEELCGEADGKSAAPAAAPSSPAPPPSGACGEGSGTFATPPLARAVAGQFADLALVPVQVAGTGALTSAARVLAWRQLYGSTLRSPADARFTPWFTRRTRAEPWFSMRGVAWGQDLSSAVEMSWDCPGTAREPPLEAAMAWDFSLADVGCGLDWPQQFVLSRTAAGALRVNLAGREAAVALDNRSFANEFHFERHGLRVRGYLAGEDAAGASLVLEEASWRDLSVCQAGSYHLRRTRGW